LDKKIDHINTQAKVWHALPNKVRQFLNVLRVMPRYFKWTISQNGKAHLRKVMLPYKDKYKNARCVVIGNGPSLNKMDLSILKDEYTFGLNRIYLLFEKWGFETSVLVSINRFVLNQFSDELRNQKLLKFFNWAYRDPYQADENTVFITPKLSYRANGNIFNGYFPIGGTVTNVALEIAYFMGFSEVVLIGVDHSFKEKGLGGTAILAQEPDQNHFSPDYFGQGTVWQLPNYVVMEQGYKQMKQLFEEDGRKIVDATVDGKLQIFPKVNFEDYLKNCSYKNKNSY